jgi:Fe2+ or Zn2+ uptake regulation protein
MDIKQKRWTAQKREILSFIKKDPYVHYYADEIYKMIRKRISNISLGTVYRNLESLAQDGYIRAISFPSQPIRYDGISTPHAHFFCESCGAIANINLDEEIDTISRKLARIHSHTICSVSCDVYGVCMRCKNKVG